MCGIVGIISKQPVDLGILKRMNDKINHRGPDGYGYLASQASKNPQTLDNLVLLAANPNFDFALAHQRLAIHDLSSAGHQPMNYMDRYWIVFNGEIYNFLEIKAELSLLGYQFNSNTDTEVIMAAYDHWGKDCLNRFNGMWAFVLVDVLTQKVFIARDRFGIKPLYYYIADGLFIFASEIKAILEWPDIKTPNVNYLKMYMQQGPKEHDIDTAFANIHRFNFAHYFEGNLQDLLNKNQFQLKRYWQIKPNLKREKFNATQAKLYAQKYYELLEDAVRLRLRADVKVGSALSGGLDSSSIVYLVNKILKEQGKEALQETFSSVYTAPGTEQCDESTYINMIAQKLKVHSSQIEPKATDIPSEHQQMIYALENPPESTCMSGWHVFKLIGASEVTVTLDGQGADEQLAGYLYYLSSYFTSISFTDLPKAISQCLAIPGASKFIWRGILLRIFQSLFGKRALKYFIKKYFKRDFEPDLNQQLAHSFTFSLVNLLHYLDHTSMFFSIESRMPFMDYRMVEFLASVPAVYKIHDGWTKYIARLAFDKKLPDEICWRRDKMGWPIPENLWFKGPLKDWFVKKIDATNRLADLAINIEGAKALEETKNIQMLIRYLNLEVFFDKFFASASQGNQHA